MQNWCKSGVREGSLPRNRAGFRIVCDAEPGPRPLPRLPTWSREPYAHWSLKAAFDAIGGTEADLSTALGDADKVVLQRRQGVGPDTGVALFSEALYYYNAHSLTVEVWKGEKMFQKGRVFKVQTGSTGAPSSWGGDYPYAIQGVCRGDSLKEVERIWGKPDEKGKEAGAHAYWIYRDMFKTKKRQGVDVRVWYNVTGPRAGKVFCFQSLGGQSQRTEKQTKKSRKGPSS